MQSTLKNSKNIISKILSNGGIAILPTDTIYSLSCITSNTNSLKQILKIKGRDAAQGIPVLVPSIDYFNVYAQNINNNIEKSSKNNVHDLNQNNCKLKEGYKLIKDISLNRMNLSQINQLSVP